MHFYRLTHHGFKALCKLWSEVQPEAFSDKTGKPDKWGMYALLFSELMLWANQWQHIPNKDIVLVGILDEKVDEFGVKQYSLQCESSKFANELIGILDQVISMVALKNKKWHKIAKSSANVKSVELSCKR